MIIPLRIDGPAEVWDGLIGSPIDAAAELDSLRVDSAEYPSPVFPASPDWFRPLHQSVTDNGPSRASNADFKAVFMSACSKLITEEAYTWEEKKGLSYISHHISYLKTSI